MFPRNARATHHPSPLFVTRTSSPVIVTGLVAFASVIRAPGIGEGAQRFEEDDEVRLLALGEVQGPGRAPVFRVQLDRVEAGVMPHYVRQRIHAAIAAVRRGQYQVA